MIFLWMMAACQEIQPAQADVHVIFLIQNGWHENASDRGSCALTSKELKDPVNSLSKACDGDTPLNMA